MSMSGCSLNDASLSGAALVMTGLSRPTAFSPLQIAAFANSDLANINGGNSPSITSITTGVVGLSALYVCYLRLSEYRQPPFVARHVQLDETLDFGHDFGNFTASLPEPSYIWLDYPAGYFPRNVDPHVDDGSTCIPSSPFAPGLCTPVETNKPSHHDLAAQDIDMHIPIKNHHSDSPSRLSFSVILGFFVELLLRCILFTGVAFVSGFAVGFLILLQRAHIDWSSVLDLLKLLSAKDPAIMFYSSVEASKRSLVRDKDVEDVHPDQTPASSPLEVAIDAEVGELNTASCIFDDEVDDTCIDTTANEGENPSVGFPVALSTTSPATNDQASAPVADILSAKKVFDEAVDAHIRRIEAQAQAAPTSKEDEIDRHIRAIEARALGQPAPLTSASASGSSSGPDSAAVSGGDTRPDGRRRRKRCKKNKKKNKNKSTNSESVPHDQADADDVDIVVEQEVVPATRHEEQEVRPSADQVGNTTDTDQEPTQPRRKRIHRGRNRGRGPRIQQPALAAVLDWAMN